MRWGDLQTTRRAYIYDASTASSGGMTMLACNELIASFALGVGAVVLAIDAMRVF